MPPSPSLPDSIERTARPFLARVSKLASEHGRAPGDYFLVIGKYAPGESMVVPRAAADEFLSCAKTEARRRKYERLLASPCDRNELLVLVTAGDHVEAHWMRVPALVPEASVVATRAVTVTQEDFKKYLLRFMQPLVNKVFDDGAKLRDCVAILRPPNEAPIVLPRAMVKEPLAIAGYSERVLAEIDKPAASDNALLCVYAVNGTTDFSIITPEFAQTEEEELALQLQDRMIQWISLAYDGVRAIGEKPSEYVAYLQFPSLDGERPEPRVFHRSHARKELQALEGTRKHEQIFGHLETPCDDVMLFVDVPHGEDIVVFWRDAEQIAGTRPRPMEIKAKTPAV